MFEHPCDDYYRQLVLKERSKIGSKMSKKSMVSSKPTSGFQGIGNVGLKPQPLQLREP
jgi:hypothetical protein